MPHKTITLDPADAELRTILGTICLRTGPIAHRLRAKGHDIECRAEAEQGYVILWMLQRYAEHGPDWRVPAQAELKSDEPKAG